MTKAKDNTRSILRIELGSAEDLANCATKVGVSP